MQFEGIANQLKNLIIYHGRKDARNLRARDRSLLVISRIFFIFFFRLDEADGATFV